MTDYANPSNSFRPLSGEMGRTLRYTGHVKGYIADGITLVSDVDSAGLTEGPLNAFAEVSESGLDVTFDTGEASLNGAVIARDTETTVTLPQTSSVTVALAYEPSVEGNVIIDTEATITSQVGDVPTLPLYDFTTDTSGVTDRTDQRLLGERIETKNARYETSDSSGLAVDNAKQLGGAPASDYAQKDEGETIPGHRNFTGGVDIDGEPGETSLHVIGPNGIDSQVVTIDGDSDPGQDDDLLKVRGVSDPDSTPAADDDTKLVVKGDGRIGVNRYNPTSPLDIDGGLTVRGESNFTDNVTVTSSLEATNTIAGSRLAILDNGYGITASIADGNRFFIAPRVNGSPQFSSEITYQHNQDEWKFETPIDTPHGRVVASPDGVYEVQKNGNNGNGIINFITE